MDQLLKQFNFSEGEMIVYKALLKSGGAKVSEIATAVGLKRTSCQEYIQSLEQKGFINSTKIGKKYLYQAEDPDKFRQIINERQFILDRLLPELKQRAIAEEWQARSLEVEEAKRSVRRAKRKEQKVVAFGDETVGGALLGGSTVVLFSTNKEVPAIEIKSKVIVELHSRLYLLARSTSPVFRSTVK